VRGLLDLDLKNFFRFIWDEAGEVGSNGEKHDPWGATVQTESSGREGVVVVHAHQSPGSRSFKNLAARA
jgi:hypothetical protein